MAIRCLTLVTRSSAPPCCLTAESFPVFETSTFDWFRSISSDKLSNYLTVWDFKTVNYSRLSFYILIADFSIPETSFHKPVAVLCPLSRLWHTADRAASGSRSCCFDWSHKFWRSLNCLGVAFGRLWKSCDGLEGWDKCIVLPCTEMPRYLAEWWQKPSIYRSIAEVIGHWRVLLAWELSAQAERSTGTASVRDMNAGRRMTSNLTSSRARKTLTNRNMTLAHWKILYYYYYQMP